MMTGGSLAMMDGLNWKTHTSLLTSPAAGEATEE
jgi:hypothetical protein